MRLPLRKTRRMLKGFCLGTSKLTKTERNRARRLRHLPIFEQRPRFRSQCKDVPRPCPWVGCRFHLFLDVNKSGSIKLNFPGVPLEEMKETCAKDVEDRGGATLDEVGAIMNLTMERIRQIEVDIIRKLRAALADKRNDHGDGK